MSRLLLLPLALLVASATARAQGAPASFPCTHPDSVDVRGNQRVPRAKIIADAGILSSDTLNFRSTARALRNLFATGDFSDVQMACEVPPGTSRAILVLSVVERPIVSGVEVSGTKIVSERAVRDKLQMPIGKPLDPAQLARSVQQIDSLYESKGYYLAEVGVDTTRHDGRVSVALHIDEGRRLAVSGVQVVGAKRLPAGEVVGAMKTRPEGFWWWRKGEFDEDKLAADVGDRIPKLYEQRGFIDAQVTHDTLVVDKANGKGLVRLTVDEGPRYHVGNFEIVGNHHFTTEDLKRFYPFGSREPSITQRVKGLFGGGGGDQGIFDQQAWDDATTQVRNLYANDGYIYARVVPVADRTTVDSQPMVNLRWEIEEGSPAIINKIEIAGNDYTVESCIRDQLVILPGDVFNQDRLIRSYQNIANMGFFESPLPPPDTRPANDKGDVDVIFHLKEKRSGSINFGASVGQGTGVGGFIGLDQPNLFGACKRASVQWQFGQYANDFQLSYTDPAIQHTRISGTATAYHTRSRYIIADLGTSTGTGGSLQFGFPVRGSPFTRLFLSYGGEAVKFSGGLAARDTTINQSYNFRSTLGLTLTNDTRIDLPFPSAGTLRSITAQFNGGPLGGTATFQRYTAELRNYNTLATIGGTTPGSQPMKLIFGLSAKAGMVFGNTGPFFYSQRFALGGTQFGEQLRGYDEFMVTPAGVIPETNSNASVSSFGSAVFTSTAELGLRFNQMLYVHTFYDAGNIWNRPREFDPTRLFRGAGIGVSIVTPLGPLGLDWAYGFDRVNAQGQRDPKWQLHFKLGNFF